MQQYAETDALTQKVEMLRQEIDDICKAETTTEYFEKRSNQLLIELENILKEFKRSRQERGVR